MNNTELPIELRFHRGLGVEPELDGSEVRLWHQSKMLASLQIDPMAHSVRLEYGADGPDIQGWISKRYGSKEPAYVVCITYRNDIDSIQSRIILH